MMMRKPRRLASLAATEIARRLRREGIACAMGNEWAGQAGPYGAAENTALPGKAIMRLGAAQSAYEQSLLLGRDSRNFLVTVHDVEALNIRRIYPGIRQGRFVRQETEPDDRLRRIVSRAAVRALYVLGIAAGDVEVMTSATGKPTIMRIVERAEASVGEVGAREAGAGKVGFGAGEREREKRLGGESNVTGVLPGTIEKGTGAQRSTGERHMHNSERKEPHQGGVMLGADPEFVLLTAAGKVAPASRYLPAGGFAGCDSVVRRGVRVWPLVELRPEPAAEPSEVVRSLRRLLLSANRRIGRAGDRLSWRAGAWPVPGLPLGGHVHISGMALTGDLLRALDNAVALPLRLLEPPGAAARRPRYGALGDFRRKPHGGFEYRTPPSWLVSPHLACGVLALARIACEHRHRLSGCRPLDDDALRDAFYQGEQDARSLAALREAALSILAKLREWSGRSRDAAAVDFVYRAVRDGRRWDETADFRSKWGIPVG